jgi:hypothetical protein
MKLVFALKEVFSAILTIPSFTQLPRRQRNISFRGKILAIIFFNCRPIIQTQEIFGDGPHWTAAQNYIVVYHDCIFRLASNQPSRKYFRE